MTLHYQHRQPATTTLVILAVILGLDAVISACILLAAGSSSLPLLTTPLLVAVVIVIVWFFLASLTVTIDDQHIRLSFGPGLVRKRIRLADVASCKVVTTRWWHGWGIHYTSLGTLYNVSGFDAVCVTLINGKRICIGTDEPEALAEAIRRAARLTTRQTAG